MRFKYLVLLILSTFVVNPSNFADEPLYLKDCISIALENNPALIKARIAVEKAVSGEIVAHSFYYPSVGFYTGATYKNKYDSYSSNIDFRYPLYRGGYFYAGLKIAKARKKIAEYNYQITEEEVIFSVKESFFRILQKQEQIRLIKNILERRQEDLILIRLKYDVGRESLPAVKESEANLLQAEYDKMQAESELAIAGIELNILLGRPQKEEITIEYEHLDVEFPHINRIIEDTKNNSPEILSARASRQVYEAQIIQAKSNLFPTLNLTFSENWSGDNFLEQENDWRAGLSLSLPIFDGFSNREGVKQARLSLKQEDVAIFELEQKIEEEIERVYSDWQLAQKNLEVCNKILDAARDMYQLTKLQYEQGLTSYFFLQQKEYALTRAEYSYANATFNLYLVCSRLEKIWSR